MGFPGGSAGKESACNAGDLGSAPGLGRSPGEGNGYPLQYSGLENPVDCIAHGVTRSQTRLSDFHFPVHGPRTMGPEVQKSRSQHWQKIQCEIPGNNPIKGGEKPVVKKV